MVKVNSEVTKTNKIPLKVPPDLDLLASLYDIVEKNKKIFLKI